MLFVIDMQNDFIDQVHGRMAVKGAERLIEPIIEKIIKYREEGDVVVFTKDSHIEVYQDEKGKGQNERIDWGHSIVDELREYFNECERFEKQYHGISPEDLLSFKKKYAHKSEYIETIELVGIETHKCVLSNAVLLQNLFPHSTIYIEEDLVMSSDKELHAQALNIMENLKMKVRRGKHEYSYRL